MNAAATKTMTARCAVVTWPTVAASLLAFWVAPAAHAQQLSTQQTREQIVERFCQAPELTSGLEVTAIRRIEGRYGPIVMRDNTHRIFVAVVASDEIKPWRATFCLRCATSNASQAVSSE
jgi:hypothetical protein